MDKQSISLIIPAYNEEANIEIVISKAIKVLRTLFQDFEVIIVDDGSFDQTKKIVNHLIQSSSQSWLWGGLKFRDPGCSKRPSVFN
jgi:glycosyltransferase involved in cell wall biosynthesis